MRVRRAGGRGALRVVVPGGGECAGRERSCIQLAVHGERAVVVERDGARVREGVAGAVVRDERRRRDERAKVALHVGLE